ncbi:MAG TPA: BatA domain-containing protein [Pirellulales bacterium]|nr:BatA domain-containing protein [Pirellulales bacterium]
MDFVTPVLLFGACAAAVPVVLHLVMRQQPRHLLFPALRFVQVRESANRRRLRLRHLLLLLLRVAAIFLLAVALARPSIKSGGLIGDEESPVAAALVFDTSPRMGYKSENKTRLEAAQETASWLLKQLPTDSLVAVVDSAPGQPVFQVDMGAAQQRVSRLETTAAPQDLWTVIEQAAELLKKGEPERKETPERKEMYIFSDLAKAEWDPQAASRLRHRLAEITGLGIYVIDVGVNAPQNLALGELRLSSESITRNRPWSIATEVQSTGLADERAVEVYIVGDNGEEQKRAQEVLKVAEGASQGIEFSLGPLDTGTHQGFVRIVGADGLEIDDRRWFTLDVKPPWKVLIAAAPPARARAWFLAQALAPDAWRQTGRARFECEVVRFADLSRSSLEDFSVVCLLDPGPLDDSLWQQIARYAEGGGGVAIFLGESTQPGALKGETLKQLLPGDVGKLPALFPDGDLHLTISNDQHPMAAKFRPLQGSIPWESLPVYRYWPIHNVAKGVTTVASYSNREPAILERAFGKGHVVTMTTPISVGPDTPQDRRWNDLPTGLEAWPYLMLVDQMGSYLAGSTDGQLNYLAGETAVLRTSRDERYNTYLLTTPRGDTYRQSADPKQRSIAIASTQWIGNYQVAAGGEQGGLNRGFSVNVAPKASDLTRTDEDGLKQVFGDAEFRLARSREEIDRNISTGRVGRELFPLLMALLAIALAVEHVLANRFYRSGDGKRRQPAASPLALGGA